MISVTCRCRNCGKFFDDIGKMNIIILQGKGKLQCSICLKTEELDFFDHNLKKYFDKIKLAEGQITNKEKSKLVNCNDEGEHHKFAARYDEKPNPANMNLNFYEYEKMEKMTADEVRKLLYYKVYLFDICEKCGKIVNRQKDNG